MHSIKFGMLKQKNWDVVSSSISATKLSIVECNEAILHRRKGLRVLKFRVIVGLLLLKISFPKFFSSS